MDIEGARDLRMVDITFALAKVQERIAHASRASGRDPRDVTLICVTKTYPVTDIEILQRLGMRDFAENREGDGADKSKELVARNQVNARWHYQGKIQSNKIKSLVAWADVIHSLDEIRHVPLLARALANTNKIDVFLQVALDQQPGRGGVLPSDLPALADAVTAQDSLRLLGLMAVGPLNEDPESAFARLGQIHSDFKAKYPDSPFLSAGMSSDFEVAIAHGATHVRVGSSILGSRTTQR